MSSLKIRSPGKLKTGAMPDITGKDGRAPCSKAARAQATIRDVRQLIVLKQGTRMPMSWPLVFGDREQDPGCPFTDQCPCQGMISSGTYLKPCRWKLRLGERDLSCPVPWNVSIRMDKEGQSVHGPSLAPLDGGKQSLSLASLEEQKPCRSLHWAGVRLPVNSWCFITLPWTAPNIGKNSWQMSCLQFGFRVLQPVGPLH